MLTQERIDSELKPRFSRVLEAHKGKQYVANHSLGRMPDAAFENSSRGVALWADKMEQAWSDDAWTGEITRFRSLIARLTGLPSANNVVMKTSAGQGLRAVLNSFPVDKKLQVVSTRGEFDSIDFILKTYAKAGRISVAWAERRPGLVPTIDAQDVMDLIGPGTDLVVVSAVMFATGQVLRGIEDLIAKAHSVGAIVVVDSYHAVGAMPFDLAAIGADFVIGGSYKYLRGAPGACFLGFSDKVLDSGRRTLDTGWYAKKHKFEFEKSEVAEVASGGDGWNESTPPVF
ncbi:MAG TPA: aminotransferase class V-fold PLP-dependent enzyme, partial [Fimbriimonas sp.]|nr:aminotransferase class V-fold PLP-dependent enzyme [Fimbriimonas sp.]